MTTTKYPIYIPSKGRWKSRLTVRALEQLGVPFRVVVEPAEWDAYAAVINPAKLLRLPHDFSRMGRGSIPARNFIFSHAMAEGHRKHWSLDDNIRNFYRLNRNRRIVVESGVVFRIAEDFTDRYVNVGLSGFHYDSLVREASETKAPFTLNTRIYSAILINHAIEPIRWRGRYNEDTDLSLRVLKAGWCTILLNAFLVKKITTLKMAGGNTDTIYATGDRRLGFAESLKEQHPELVEVVWKFNRWHHQVDYSGFRQRLILRHDAEIPAGPNEYGMRLVELTRPVLYSEGTAWRKALP